MIFPSPKPCHPPILSFCLLQTHYPVILKAVSPKNLSLFCLDYFLERIEGFYFISLSLHHHPLFQEVDREQACLLYGDAAEDVKAL